MINSSSTIRLPLFGLRAWLLAHLFGLAYRFYRRYYKTHRLSWSVTRANLASYECGSLGRELHHFLGSNGLDMLPRFEEHDVCHLLTGYGLSTVEEASMQFCLVGNGKRSFNSLGTCGLAWLAFPEHWSSFRRAYRRGRAARRFQHWCFEYLLQEPLCELQHFIFSLGVECTEKIRF